MKVTDGRGVYKTLVAKKNKKSVALWFKNNPGSTITECCRALNLSYPTVRKNLNALIEKKEIV